MANMSFFKEENKETTSYKLKWKILIADDEQDVHTLTKTVLKDFEYQGKGIEFISTYNEEETILALQEHKDVAMIFLDVVMDSDDAGLKVAKRIREELNNNLIQIILRTGQAGSAPETDVVVNYAINDYKEKTELTSKKLITTIVTALRSYKTLKSVESNKKGLQQIIDASETFYEKSSNQLLSQGILTQILSLLKIDHDAVLVEHIDSLSIENKGEESTIINSAGLFDGVKNFDELDQEVKDLIQDVIRTKKSIFTEHKCVGYLKLDTNHSNIIYISGYENINEIEKNLVEVFFRHSSVALNNLKLNEEMFSTQKKLIEVLGDVVEKRYVDDPNHIRRVADMSYLLAKKIGLDEEEASILRMVSPMHDVGKIGISDAILLKPAKLTTGEFETMKDHSTIGYNILKGTGKKTLDKAALVAYEHHEKWDGSGYPMKKKGEEISIYGRITALIDVYDALFNKRCYKDAWEITEITDYIKEQKAKQFDPRLVEVFLENIDEFIKIQNTSNFLK